MSWENPTVSEALEHELDSSRGDTHSLLDWIAAAWR
ncbi:mCG148382 [Mus musculus]|nr:mCG148382 [Mus musculus]